MVVVTLCVAGPSIVDVLPPCCAFGGGNCILEKEHGIRSRFFFQYFFSIRILRFFFCFYCSFVCTIHKRIEFYGVWTTLSTHVIYGQEVYVRRTYLHSSHIKWIIIVWHDDDTIYACSLRPSVVLSTSSGLDCTGCLADIFIVYFISLYGVITGWKQVSAVQQCISSTYIPATFCSYLPQCFVWLVWRVWLSILKLLRLCDSWMNCRMLHLVNAI